MGGEILGHLLTMNPTPSTVPSNHNETRNALLLCQESEPHTNTLTFFINLFWLEANYFTILWWFFFAIYWHESATDVHVSPILNPLLCPSPPHPLGCPSAPALSALFHASNLDWSWVSHMVIYTFQCYSFKSSRPCLLPQSPKVCSLYLCLFCCLACRVIITIFLNSIYMH